MFKDDLSCYLHPFGEQDDLCITVSGSESHQLLAAWRKGGNHQTSHKMRARPHYLRVVSQRWGRAPIIRRARTHYFGCSPKPTSTHPLSKSPPSCLPATSADPPSPLYLGQGRTTYPSTPFWPQILHWDLVASGWSSNNITGDHYES